MINLMKHTYLFEIDKIKTELEKLWERYLAILNNENSNWKDLNEARAILFIIGNVYCEDVAVKAIEKRLHLLKNKLTPIEFFNLIDSNSARLTELRKEKLFTDLEEFYKIIKEFKNKNSKGKFYLDEDIFIEKYNKANPDKNLKIGYKGGFDKSSIDFMK